VFAEVTPLRFETYSCTQAIEVLQGAEMYFAPALSDICERWSVPPRTAAALFVALANGAPDLAATGSMFKIGLSAFYHRSTWCQSILMLVEA
jgi:hypothetical protein